MYPGPLTYTYTNVTVGATSTLIAAANEKRFYLMIVNRSTEAVDVKSGAAAVAGEGIALNPTVGGAIQGFYVWSAGEGNLSREAIYGICSSGSKTVTVMEG